MKKKKTKEKWDKPIPKRAFNAICKKLASYEKKYGFEGLRWSVNKYISLRTATMKREKHIKELEGELTDLKSKQKSFE